MFFDILTILILLVVLLIFLPAIRNPLAYAPPIPINPSHKYAILEMFDNMEASNLKVCEIGSGWGGMLIGIAKSPKVKTVLGIELSPILYLWCVVRRLLITERKKVYLRLDSALSTASICKINEADVIVIYGFKEFNRKLYPKLRPGLQVISSCFDGFGTNFTCKKVGLANLYHYTI